MPKACNGDRWRAAILVLLPTALTVLLAACALQPRDDPPTTEVRRGDSVRVASFDFAESELLGELFAQALERQGITVDRVLALGSREVVEPALQQGLVDVVPEYLAAALDFETFAGDLPDDAEEAARRLQAELSDDGVTVLGHAPAIDRDAVAMHAARASELGIDTLSDLAEHAGSLDFVGPPECPERSACLPHLRARYAIEFRSFTALPPGLPIALALAAEEADVGLMFSSDPLVEEHGLVLIEDDRGPGRPENVVPLVRDEVLDQHGEAIDAGLAPVTDALTTGELVRLNRRVADGETPAQVARDWLDEIAVTD